MVANGNVVCGPFTDDNEINNNNCAVKRFQYRTIQDPASQRLTWYKPPLTVLVIKKVRDASVHLPFVQLVQWLIENRNYRVVINIFRVVVACEICGLQCIA
ncbi:hypothetical protein GEV33_010275 [Tenebrio molitor]|uniref:Uncharacterized protein n=1 Tax=Tenebrio molitor TaxID=7067 RepID=A0A8J6LGQ2_TENMO|nr:hypothetical protein GEV33_010275 [Tenebrio molitor]